MSKKKKKIRTSFRKNRGVRTRDKNLTRDYKQHGFENSDVPTAERISGKGELTRKRTIVGSESDVDETGLPVQFDVDKSRCQLGRVLRVQGLLSTVQAEDGRMFECATRGILKTLSTEQRHVVAVGDRVWFRPEGQSEGMIESVEPRHGVLSRSIRGRQQVIVAGVDQMLIVASAAEPYLKPNLIDRYLVTAEKGGIRPLICINKVDLVDPAHLQPLVGVYSQLGYRVLLLSAETGLGIDRLRRRLAGKQSVFAGQSGVGKSSLINAVDPNVELTVQTVSEESHKGRHTTTSAQLIRLSEGGYVVDTPGIRQFQLWDVLPEELAGFYRDLRPFVSQCRFPDCTHTHEADCAVKDAVADLRIDARRYESYVHIHAGDEP
ncbi:MAG: ribosome small subunit-dependent GTPase A [Pirellulales bacterium]